MFLSNDSTSRPPAAKNMMTGLGNFKETAIDPLLSSRRLNSFHNAHLRHRHFDKGSNAPQDLSDGKAPLLKTV